MKRISLLVLVFLIFHNLSAQVEFKSAGLLVGINQKAELVRLVNSSTGTNYLPAGKPGYLVRVKNTDKQILLPTGFKLRKDVLTFTFDGATELRVKATESADHIRFEVIKVTNPANIDCILWGPFNTTIDETIGEVVGVVWDKDFAIGIQALNSKTIGGKLTNDAGATAGFAGINGSTATKEEFGSALQAFCMNHTLSRKLDVPGFMNCPIQGLEGYTLEGTAIALFGTSAGNVLQTIGSISKAESLPYPEIEGQWIRTSPERGRPYLITEFTEENFDEMLLLTERLGFYCIYHEGPFETWGHYSLLKDEFPHGRTGMKACVEKATAKNIRVGVHTLTNFITTNDPFVTTNSNTGLMAAGTSLLTEMADSNTTNIAVNDTLYFAPKSNLNAVLIGNEIIRYQDVTREKPYTLQNCIRGAYGTKAVPHPKGEVARKLMDHGYNTFFPGWEMQDQMIQNLADFFNETGVSQLDFDGHEGALYTGYGDYGTNYFAYEFLKRVNHTVINGSSIINHFYWHNNSYINWGEPWYASFRESQSEHRFSLQPFFERNYMPHMLGWFLVTPNTTIEDIEWMMSVAAGYNAGYALVMSHDAFKTNPDIDRIVETIVRWEEAKKLGIFSEAQNVRLKDPKNDFHLEKVAGKEWTLQNFDKYRFEHAKQSRQPGESAFSKWEFENTSGAQPVHLHMQVTGEGSVVENIDIEVDNFYRVSIPATVKKGESLVWDGSQQVKHFNEKGKLIKSIAIYNSLPDLKKGPHSIKIQAAKMEGDEPVIKGVVRLKGSLETIKL